MYAHRNFDDDEIDDENCQVHVIIEQLLGIPVGTLHRWQEMNNQSLHDAGTRIEMKWPKKKIRLID